MAQTFHLTVHPKTLKFPNEWNMYAHIQSNSCTYVNSFVAIGKFDNVEDFWCLINNVPSVYSLYDGAIKLRHQQVTAYSIFLKNRVPEWNTHSCIVGFKDIYNRHEFADMWCHFVLALVNNEISNVSGIRFVNKTVKQYKRMYKVEFWMSDASDAAIGEIRSFLNESYPKKTCFQVLLHENHPQYKCH